MSDLPEQRHCCGCSCHVCANGHSGGYHSEACQERVYAQSETLQRCEEEEEP